MRISKGLYIFIFLFFSLFISIYLESIYQRNHTQRIISFTKHGHRKDHINYYFNKSSQSKGNIIFIGGSSIPASIRIKYFNQSVPRENRASFLYLQPSEIKSSYEYIKTILENKKIRYIIIHEHLLRSKPILSKTFNSYAKRWNQIFEENNPLRFKISQVIMYFLTSPARIISRFCIKGNGKNHYGYSSLINGFYKEHLQLSNMKQLELDNLYKEKNKFEKSKIDIRQRELITRIIKLSKNRGVIPILFIHNNSDMKLKNSTKVVIQAWNSISNYPIFYISPKILFSDHNEDHKKLFMDKNHFNEAGAQLYSKYFFSGFYKFLSTGNNKKYQLTR